MVIQEQSVKKILMTADSVGGVWTYALDLCRAFSTCGIQVCLATMGAPLSVSQRADALKIMDLDLRESSYKLEWMDDPWEDIENAGTWLLAIENEIEPDIIHLNSYAFATLQWRVPVVIIAHSCVLSWWEAVKKQPAPASWDKYKCCVQQGLKAADAVVAISHSYADELQQLYGTMDNITVIYNGRDAALFYAAASKKLQLFAMGRVWDEAKNLPALGKLVNKNALPILIAGDNRHPATGKPANIPDVRLLGILNATEVREQLACSYIYVHPALYEPFGLSVLEAALSGCLLLLADIPTLRELWQDAALYFDPERPAELDKLLNHVLEQPELCKSIIKRAGVRAKLFTLDNMAEKYLDLYGSLLHQQLKTQTVS